MGKYRWGFRMVCPWCLEPRCKCKRRRKAKTTTINNTQLKHDAVNPTSGGARDKTKCGCSPNSHILFPYNLPPGFQTYDNPDREPCVILGCQYMAVIVHTVKVDLEFTKASTIRKLCPVHGVYYVRQTCPKEVKNAFFRGTNLVMANQNVATE